MRPKRLEFMNHVARFALEGEVAEVKPGPVRNLEGFGQENFGPTSTEGFDEVEDPQRNASQQREVAFRLTTGVVPTRGGVGKRWIEGARSV